MLLFIKLVVFFSGRQGGGGMYQYPPAPVVSELKDGHVMQRHHIYRERSGSVVECLTQDRRAVGSSPTGVTALWSLSRTHLS